MDIQPQGHEKVAHLIEKGVTVPSPLTVYVSDDVDLDHVSGDGVVLWPGCRIQGARTVISAGCKLGAEAPVTLVDCQLGPGVELKGGYFKRSVFLENANMGSGAQVREGCLLEEEANGAHCVGLKQTILFPFVTLGSLINFCDCFMAGGTSRKDHSEVGSSYVHFNYTPDGDKTTASLFGDVARGVMLDQPPIFLGGQGGAVGPVRVGYGTVVAAGSVLRRDVLDDGKLVYAVPPAGAERDRRPFAYRSLPRIVRNNVIYLANLMALEYWYTSVRRAFFAQQEMGLLVYEGALDVLSLAKEERLKRLRAMAAKVPAESPTGSEFSERIDGVCAVFEAGLGSSPDALLSALGLDTSPVGNYLETIRGLGPVERSQGVRLLSDTVDAVCEQVDEHLRSMHLFDI